MATSDQALEYKQEYDGWLEEYQIDIFLEFNEENQKIVERMDPRLVWTEHGTCETPQVTSGVHIYNSGCGCWETFGWHIGKVQWEPENDKLDETYICYKTSVYLECPTCNPDGENENVIEGCPGDEELGGECEDGWITYYFD